MIARQSSNGTDSGHAAASIERIWKVRNSKGERELGRVCRTESPAAAARCRAILIAAISDKVRRTSQSTVPSTEQHARGSRADKVHGRGGPPDLAGWSLSRIGRRWNGKWPNHRTRQTGRTSRRRTSTKPRSAQKFAPSKREETPANRIAAAAALDRPFSGSPNHLVFLKSMVFSAGLDLHLFSTELSENCTEIVTLFRAEASASHVLSWAWIRSSVSSRSMIDRSARSMLRVTS